MLPPHPISNSHPHSHPHHQPPLSATGLLQDAFGAHLGQADGFGGMEPETLVSITISISTISSIRSITKQQQSTTRVNDPTTAHHSHEHNGDIHSSLALPPRLAAGAEYGMQHGMMSPRSAFWVLRQPMSNYWNGPFSNDRERKKGQVSRLACRML